MSDSKPQNPIPGVFLCIESASEVEPGSEEGDAKGESTEDAEAQTTDEA